MEQREAELQEKQTPQCPPTDSAPQRRAWQWQVLTEQGMVYDGRDQTRRARRIARAGYPVDARTNTEIVRATWEAAG